MLDSLFQLSDINLFLILCGFFIFASIIAVILVKWFVPLDTRYRDNAVIGNVSSMLALIYGVLAGLTALYLINNNSYTSDAEIREANAIADIYHDSRWLTEPSRTNIQNELKKYINIVISKEWPLMEKNESIDRAEGVSIISNITNDLVKYNSITNQEALIIHDISDEVKMLYDSRQQRIHMSETELSPELWLVILIGTMLTLFINYLFGMNFYLHLITVCAASLMTSSMLFLLITLDRPFQGEFNIRPDAFKRILHLIESNEIKAAIPETR